MGSPSPCNQGSGDSKDVFFHSAEKGLHQVVQVLEVLVKRRPAGAGKGHQLTNRQLAEGMRPKKLQRSIKDRLAEFVRIYAAQDDSWDRCGDESEIVLFLTCCHILMTTCQQCKRRSDRSYGWDSVADEEATAS